VSTTPSISPQETDIFKIVAIERWLLSHFGPQGAHSAVMGLTADPNVGSPSTKVDIAYSAATLQSSDGQFSFEVNQSFTVDCGAAGPVLNGRDQAAAFTANQFLYFYTIDAPGQTTGGLVSTVPPTTSTGPTLPSGYTKWAFLFSARWSTNSVLIAQYVRGNLVTFQVAQGIASTSLVQTAVQITTSAVIPAPAIAPNVNMLGVLLEQSGTNNTLNIQEVSTGNPLVSIFTPANGAGTATALMANVANTVFIKLGGAGIGILQAIGYTVANGAS
jgi:hypothetical protein